MRLSIREKKSAFSFKFPRIDIQSYFASSRLPNSQLYFCLYVLRHECCWSFFIACFLKWRKPCARLELAQNVWGVYKYSTLISHFTMDDYRGIFRRLYFFRSLPRCEIKQIWFGKLDFITRRCVTKTECDPAIITNKVAVKIPVFGHYIRYSLSDSNGNESNSCTRMCSTTSSSDDSVVEDPFNGKSVKRNVNDALFMG